MIDIQYLSTMNQSWLIHIERYLGLLVLEFALLKMIKESCDVQSPSQQF